MRESHINRGDRMIIKMPKLRLDILSDYRAACYGFCAIWIVHVPCRCKSWL